MATIIFDTHQASKLLANGKIVALPTETVYGLAGCPRTIEIVETIYQLKKRPLDKALAINVHPSWDIRQWALDIPEYVFQLIHQFWPGPLSIILKANLKIVPLFLIGPQNTVSFRCPNHPMTLDVLQELGEILVAPSANPSHHLSPTHPQQVWEYFKHDEVYVLDGGACQLGIESTILKANDSKDYEILRQGAVSVEQIIETVGFSPSDIREHQSSGQLLIPMFYYENIQELQNYLQKYPGIRYQSISRKTIQKAVPLENQVILPLRVQEIEKNFYQILQQSQKGSHKVVLIESLRDLKKLHEIIKKYAKPIIFA